MDDNDMSLASIVLTNPIILQNIFRYIPIRALNTCSRVCQLWAYTVKHVKTNRRGMAWHYHLCDESEKTLDQLAQGIETFRENLYFEPRFAFIFCSTNLHDETIAHLRGKHRGRLRTAKKDKVEVSVYVERQMPSGCRFTTITADGIIGTSSDQKTTEEMEGKRCLSFIVFSEFTNDTNIIPLYYDADDGSKLASFWSGQSNSVEVEKVSDKLVKSVVFLCDEAFCPQEVGFSLYKMYKCPMIAGGFVDNVLCPTVWSNERDTPFLCCLAFCGKDLKVASVVIKDDVYATEEVDRIMKKLKDSRVPEKNSVGFMFACVGRGESHYGEKNVEANAFRKHFPNTPLLGFFGNGEVGFEYPHSLPGNGAVQNNGSVKQQFIQSQPPVCPPKMYHAYTTIMTIMSFSS